MACTFVKNFFCFALVVVGVAVVVVVVTVAGCLEQQSEPALPPLISK